MSDINNLEIATTREKIKNFSRIWHRRLGVVVGIQFLFWTIGGAYFAWFHIENVRGNHDKNPSIELNIDKSVSYAPLERILARSELDEINDVRLANAHGVPVYFVTKNKDEAELYDAISGSLLTFTKDDAIHTAQTDLKPGAAVKAVAYITERGGEYSGALPAWRVDFDNTKATHIYVHEKTGLVTSRRNTIWRGFDFLWMLHILDFEDRENFNNWLLKAMSILSVITILLGYALWATTTPLLRKKD